MAGRKWNDEKDPSMQERWEEPGAEYMTPSDGTTHQSSSVQPAKSQERDQTDLFSEVSAAAAAAAAAVPHKVGNDIHHI